MSHRSGCAIQISTRLWVIHAESLLPSATEMWSFFSLPASPSLMQIFPRAGNLTTPENTCHVKKFNLSSFLFALQLPPNDRLHNSNLLLLLTCNQRSKLTGRRNFGRKICCYLQFQTIHQPTQKHHNKRALQDLNRKSEPFTVCQSTSR